MVREIGKYFIFLGHLFTNRETFKTYYKLTLDECVGIGIGSILLVALVATFMGAVTTVQTAFNMVSPLIPNYVISQVVREMTVLELAPTIIAIIYAGLGENDQAFKWLGIACSEHTMLPGPLRFDPRLDNLRTDPRFKEILKSVGLPS